MENVMCFVFVLRSVNNLMRANCQPKAKDMTWPFPHIMRGSLSTKTVLWHVCFSHFGNKDLGSRALTHLDLICWFRFPLRVLEGTGKNQIQLVFNCFATAKKGLEGVQYMNYTKKSNDTLYDLDIYDVIFCVVYFFWCIVKCKLFI